MYPKRKQLHVITKIKQDRDP